MIETWIFYIVGNLKDKKRARVYREYFDKYDVKAMLPENTLFIMNVELDIGDVIQWQSINETLRKEAAKLGIEHLDNLDPDPEIQEIIAKANRISQSA
jgi:hypothetical protein